MMYQQLQKNCKEKVYHQLLMERHHTQVLLTNANRSFLFCLSVVPANELYLSEHASKCTTVEW